MYLLPLGFIAWVTSDKGLQYLLSAVVLLDMGPNLLVLFLPLVGPPGYQLVRGAGSKC